jgi:hypothetical protein
MKLYLREKKGIQGATIVAVVTVVVDQTNKNAMKYADTKLNEFVDSYIGYRPFNRYKHIELDTVSVTIVFSTDEFSIREFDV